MIAFGVCIGNEDKYQSFAVPGLRRVWEQGGAVLESRDNASIFSAYNEMLDAAAHWRDLEALVLIHEDTELRDSTLPGRLRMLLKDEAVAVVGAVGARRVPGLAWWEGETAGRCEETRGLVDFGGGTHDVDVVDGLLMVMSPWAVRTLRFDTATFSGFHGYDMDICFQAKSMGRRVLVTDINLFHHTKGGFGDLDSYLRTDGAFRSKWGLPGDVVAASNNG